VLFGASVLAPLFFFSMPYLQRVLDHRPQEAGLAYLPMAQASLSGAAIASRVMSRTLDGSYVRDVLGPFVLLGFGPVIAALIAAATDRSGRRRPVSPPG